MDQGNAWGGGYTGCIQLSQLLLIYTASGVFTQAYPSWKTEIVSGTFMAHQALKALRISSLGKFISALRLEAEFLYVMHGVHNAIYLYHFPRLPMIFLWSIYETVVILLIVRSVNYWSRVRLIVNAKQ